VAVSATFITRLHYLWQLDLEKTSDSKFLNLTFSQSDPIDDERKPSDGISSIMECFDPEIVVLGFPTNFRPANPQPPMISALDF
jgi:hypothetical protein